MEDFLFFHDDALSILKQHHSQPNGNDAVNDDTLLFISKALILRSIRDRTENCSVPNDILDSLILIANLDRRRGFPPSVAMREAFCAVAVHVTLRCLPLSMPRYFDAVQRVWGLQIKNLEESGSSDLLSPGLDRWRNEIERALWDKLTSQRLSGINTLCEALKRIRVYLEEAFLSMKHALLEPDRVASETVHSQRNEIPRETSQTRRRLCPSLGQPKGVLVACLDENRLSCSKNGIQSNSELEENKVLLKPRAALLEEVTGHYAEPSQAKEGNEAFVRPENVRRISILDRNDTAPTVEWVDSIDGSVEGTNEAKYVLKKSEPKRKKGH